MYRIGNRARYTIQSLYRYLYRRAVISVSLATLPVNIVDIAFPCYLHPIYGELEFKIPRYGIPALPGMFQGLGHLIPPPRNNFMGKGN